MLEFDDLQKSASDTVLHCRTSVVLFSFPTFSDHKDCVLSVKLDSVPLHQGGEGIALKW